jgi:hypothetical protein
MMELSRSQLSRVEYHFHGYHPELRNCPNLLADALGKNEIISVSEIRVNGRKAKPAVIKEVNKILRARRRLARATFGVVI